MTCFYCKGNIESSTTTYMTDYQGCSVVIGMKTDAGGAFKFLVKNEVYLIVFVVDQTEERDRAGLYAQKTFHTFFRCERKAAFADYFFEPVSVKFL